MCSVGFCSAYFYFSIFSCFYCPWFTIFRLGYLSIFYCMSNCCFYFTMLTFLNYFSCTWFHSVVYNVLCFKFYKVSLFGFKSTCEVLASYFNYCVNRLSFYNFWFSNYLRIFNCPSSYSFTNPAWSYFFIFSSFHIRVIYYFVAKWNFFFMLVSSFSLRSNSYYSLFWFCSFEFFLFCRFLFTIFKVLDKFFFDISWFTSLINYHSSSFKFIIEDNFSFVWNFFFNYVFKFTSIFLCTNNYFLSSIFNHCFFFRFNLASFWIVIISYNCLYFSRSKFTLFCNSNIQIRVVFINNIYWNSAFFCHTICSRFLTNYYYVFYRLSSRSFF